MEGITIYQVIVSAILVETVWSTVEIIIDAVTIKNYKTIVKSCGSLLIGVLIAVNYKLDLPGVIGLIDHYEITGVILTGILISRGSSFIHDLIKTLENLRATTKNGTTINNFNKK